jgi:hypothetical protein
MAFAVLGPGKGLPLKPEVARRLQDIKDGKIIGLPHEQEKAALIKKIYFSDHAENELSDTKPVVHVVEPQRLPYKD